MKIGSRKQFCFAASILALSLISVGQSTAASMSVSGTFNADDQVQLYAWTLAQNSPVLLTTTSYGSGGFVPVLSIFNSAGTLVTSNGADGVCQGGMMPSSSTGMCDDALIMTNLAAGSYTIAISEFFNVPNGPNISDGFLMQGQGNFTGATCGTTGAFYQTDVAPCVQRTGNFAATFSSVPEPATACLLGLPLLVFGLARRRKIVGNR
jgi:hypothetical protein